jgi:hypothetical protein
MGVNLSNYARTNSLYGGSSPYTSGLPYANPAASGTTSLPMQNTALPSALNGGLMGGSNSMMGMMMQLLSMVTQMLSMLLPQTGANGGSNPSQNADAQTGGSNSSNGASSNATTPNSPAQPGAESPGSCGCNSDSAPSGGSEPSNPGSTSGSSGSPSPDSTSEGAESPSPNSASPDGSESSCPNSSPSGGSKSPSSDSTSGGSEAPSPDSACPGDSESSGPDTKPSGDSKSPKPDSPSPGDSDSTDPSLVDEVGGGKGSICDGPGVKGNSNSKLPSINPDEWKGRDGSNGAGFTTPFVSGNCKKTSKSISTELKGGQGAEARFHKNIGTGFYQVHLTPNASSQKGDNTTFFFYSGVGTDGSQKQQGFELDAEYNLVKPGTVTFGTWIDGKKYNEVTVDAPKGGQTLGFNIQPGKTQIGYVEPDGTFKPVSETKDPRITAKLASNLNPMSNSWRMEGTKDNGESSSITIDGFGRSDKPGGEVKRV